MNEIEGVPGLFWHEEMGAPKRPWGRLWYFSILMILWTAFASLIVWLHHLVEGHFVAEVGGAVLVGLLVFAKRRLYSPKWEGHLHRTASFYLPNAIFLGCTAFVSIYRTIRKLALGDRTMVFVMRGRISEREMRIYEVPERECGISSLPFVGLADHNVIDVKGEWPVAVWLPALNFTFSRPHGPLGTSTPWMLPEPQWRSCLLQGHERAPKGTKLTVLMLTTKIWGDSGREGSIAYVEVMNDGVCGEGQQVHFVGGDPEALVGMDVATLPDEVRQQVPEALRAREVMFEQRGRTFATRSRVMHYREISAAQARFSLRDEAPDE